MTIRRGDVVLARIPHTEASIVNDCQARSPF